LNGQQIREVSSLSQFIEVLKEIPRDPLTPLFHRGLGRSDFPLQPKLFRDERWEQSERELFNEIIAERPEEFASDQLAFDRLVRAQHYGIPTRLLDFTTNPLIALFFACENQEHLKNEGQVRTLRPTRCRIKSFYSDSVSLKANLATLSKDEKNGLIHEASEVSENFRGAHSVDFSDQFDKNYRLGIEAVNNLPNFRKLAQFIKDEKPYFENRLEPRHLGVPEFCLPKKSNARIAAQSGCFLILGNGDFASGKSNNAPAHEQLGCLRDTITLDLLINIPAVSKKGILNELETVGIDGGTAFPELERVAKRITDRYLD